MLNKRDQAKLLADGYTLLRTAERWAGNNTVVYKIKAMRAGDTQWSDLETFRVKAEMNARISRLCEHPRTILIHTHEPKTGKAAVAADSI